MLALEPSAQTIHLELLTGLSHLPTSLFAVPGAGVAIIYILTVVLLGYVASRPVIG